jgi:3-oxoacyl-[acyl-carrier-protein] synthase-3
LPLARVTGTGSYLPEKVLTNADLERIVDTSDEWITERTGIRERRVADDSQTSADLAYEAATAALKSAGLKARELDLIVVGTVTPDMPFPSTACILQSRLGARHAAAFDVNAACSGFLFALSVGNSFVVGGQAKRALVVGTEMLSKFTDWEDRTTCVLFGDGAGAVVLEEAKDDGTGILSVDIHSDGSMGDLLCIPGGGSKLPPSVETIANKQHFIRMKGNETFKVAVKTLEKIAVDTLRKNKISASDLALLIPHQANLRIIQATAKRLRLPEERVMVNIDRMGNTSSASIPIALDEAVRYGRVRKDDYILMEAFGGGLTWASALVKWSY